MHRPHPPEPHPPHPRSPPSLGSALPPLPPPHLCPWSVPLSHRPCKTGAPGWSGSVQSILIAIRAVQSWQSSCHWTSARQPRPPAPPPLFPPFPYVHLPPPPSFPLLPFCRHPPMGRCGNFANHQPRRTAPTFVQPRPTQGGAGTCLSLQELVYSPTVTTPIHPPPSSIRGTPSCLAFLFSWLQQERGRGLPCAWW